MDEAELCDRIALIQKGEILEIDTPAGIIQKFEKQLFVVRTTQIYPALNALERAPETKHAFSFGQEIHVYANASTSANAIKEILENADLADATVALGKPNIEDCFMDLMVRGNQNENAHA
jgi:ABC-type multidrug transport system ATPase subunit